MDIPQSFLDFAGQFGLGGLFMTLIVIAVISGTLLPKSILTEMRRDRDSWRRTAETALETNRILTDTNEQQAESLQKLTYEFAATTNRFLNSLPPNANQNGASNNAQNI